MTIIDRGWNEIQRKLRQLESKKVDVGLQGDAGSDIVNRAFLMSLELKIYQKEVF